MDFGKWPSFFSSRASRPMGLMFKDTACIGINVVYWILRLTFCLYAAQAQPAKAQASPSQQQQQSTQAPAQNNQQATATQSVPTQNGVTTNGPQSVDEGEKEESMDTGEKTEPKIEEVCIPCRYLKSTGINIQNICSKKKSTSKMEIILCCTDFSYSEVIVL